MGRQGREFQDRGTERRFGADRPQFDKPRGRGDFARPDSRGGDRPRNFEARGERPTSRPPWAGNNDRGGSFDRPRTGTFRREGGSQGGYGRPNDRFNDRGPDRGFDRGGERGNDRFNDRPRFSPPSPRSEAPAARAPVAKAVSVQQLKAGIGQANKALAEVVEQFGTTLRGDYDIGAIEVSVSFDADGRFMGFGSGGAASMKLSLTPLDAESVIEGDEAEEAEDDEDEFEELTQDSDEQDDEQDDVEDDAEEQAAAPNGADQDGEQTAHFDA